jgi:glycosyltransferase involved in cell wall biosynthesis
MDRMDCTNCTDRTDRDAREDCSACDAQTARDVQTAHAGHAARTDRDAQTAREGAFFNLKRLLSALFSRGKQNAVTKSILFVSPTGDFSNGAEISVFQLMKHLAGRGHRVFNVYPEYSPQAEDAYRAACNATGITPICVPELRWWPDAPGGDINTPPDAPADLAAIGEICEIIRANAVDVVISNTVNVYHGALAAAECEVRHIWLIHEFPCGEFSYYRNKISFISAYSDALFCVEGTLRESLGPELCGREIGTFLPYTNPGELGEFATNLPGRIVCIGLISERKNQLELLRAYAMLPEELKERQLVFIGGDDANYRSGCDDFIARGALTGISFLGNRENPWRYVSSRDIVVLPSKSETFGCVYAEALMCGVPVIASDNPGFTKVNRLFGGGRLYPCGDVDALARTMEETLRNFDAEHALAEANAPQVRDAFAVEKAYAQVIVEVASDESPLRKDYGDLAWLNETNRGDLAWLNELIVKPS